MPNGAEEVERIGSRTVDLSDKPALRSALDYVAARLMVEIPTEAVDLYFAGKFTDPGLYEKLGTGSLPDQPFWNYMLAAEGYLRQPSLASYYDIFRATRCIPLVRRLDLTLKLFSDEEIALHRTRIQRATTRDALDAWLFELIVAGAYRQRFANAAVSFVPENPTRKSPDILVDFPHGPPLYVECKTFNRTNDFQAKLRAKVRDLFTPVIALLRARHERLAIHAWFQVHPDHVDPAELLAAVNEELLRHKAVSREDFRMSVHDLGPADEDFLYPSPKYFSKRFGYVPEQWHGIIPALEGRPSGVSFFETAAWDAAVLWRIEHEDTLWRGNKLNFQLLFKGLAQMKEEGRLNLHAWFERSSAWGDRAAYLHRFFDELAHVTEPFSHIVFNETYPEITPQGRFDFQEHASAIGGPSRTQDRPEVTTVFSEPGDRIGVGDWGVGLKLPSLDEA
jgi:hypothetical protein